LALLRNPQLPQSLPAAKQEELKLKPDFAAVLEELAALRGRRDPDSLSSRNKLYAEKRNLVYQELRTWQKARSYRPDIGEKNGALPCYHRSLFNRVRFLTPKRDRLTSTLFKTAALHSPTSLNALRDIIALCRTDTEVAFRPGLKPDKLLMRKLNAPPETAPINHPGRHQYADLQITYDWKHIYNCFKKTHPGFAELCFLCHKWVFSKPK
jgi:hypothetical protein